MLSRNFFGIGALRALIMYPRKMLFHLDTFPIPLTGRPCSSPSSAENGGVGDDSFAL